MLLLFQRRRRDGPRCLLLLLAAFINRVRDIRVAGEEVATQVGVLEGHAELPCGTNNLSLSEVALMRWYKGNGSTPVFTLDSRTSEVRKFPGEQLGALRASVDIAESGSSVLRIKPVFQEDEGIYRCRVDYKQARAEDFFVRLNVTVPPRETIIMDEFGQRLQGVIGPYNEGASLFLVCEADGGSPPPAVTWWRESVLIDDTYSVTIQRFARNELMFPTLRRGDLMAILVCQASNTNLTMPVSSAIKLDLNLKPLDVKITTRQRPLSAGRMVEVVCETRGSRPPAEITWWKESQRLADTTETTIESNDMTESSLIFLPSIADNGKSLFCRADNPLLPGSGLDAVWVLDVKHVPQLSLSVVEAGNPLVEGKAATLECGVQANPPVATVTWAFNGKLLPEDQDQEIVMANQSLYIKEVGRQHRGIYQCMARNKEGQGKSLELALAVAYSPVCRTSEASSVYGIALNEAVMLPCEVEAEPPDVVFHWTLNNTLETVLLKSFLSNGTRSVLNYAPLQTMDYGIVECWARNSVGKQRSPCSFSVIPAGPPDPPQNCLVVNQTVDSLALQCEPGYGGGLQQHFHLEVFNIETKRVQTNVSASAAPIFVACNLPSGSTFILAVYAANEKGRSSSLTLRGYTLIPPEVANVENPEELGVAPMLGFLLGIFGVLLLVAVIMTAWKKIRIRSRVRGNKKVASLKKEKPSIVDMTSSGEPESHALDLISTTYSGRDQPDITNTSMTKKTSFIKEYKEEIRSNTEKFNSYSPAFHQLSISSVRWNGSDGTQEEVLIIQHSPKQVPKEIYTQAESAKTSPLLIKDVKGEREETASTDTLLSAS